MQSFENKIESYLSGELSSPEKAAFEAAMRQDATLAEQVARHREMLKRLDALRLRRKVKSAMNDSSGSFFRSNNAVYLLLFMAALIATAVWWQWGRNQTVPVVPTPSGLPVEPERNPVETVDSGETDLQNSQKNMPPVTRQTQTTHRAASMALVDRFYRPVPTGLLRDLSSTNSPDGTKSATIRAAESFDRRDYTLAAQLLQDKVLSEDHGSLFLRAHARFKSGDYTGAALDMKMLEDSFQYQYDARWNYMLCQLALGKTTHTLVLLDDMARDDSFPFQKQATELMRELKPEK